MNITTSPRWSRTTVQLCALIVTVEAVLAGSTARYRDAFTDETVYRLLARNLLQHGFFGYSRHRSIAYRAPGYPFFDAAVRFLSNGSTAVRVAQAMLAGITVLVAAWIAARLFGRVAAAVTAVALLLTATLAVYASFELSETLATATLVGSVAMLLVAWERKTTLSAAAAGALLGVSVLSRPQTLFLIPVVGAYFALASREHRRAALTFALVAFALLTPWTVRNAVRLHAFVPVSSYGGINLYLANNPDADGRFHRANLVSGDEEFKRIASLPEARQDREWYRKAFTFMREHPGRTVRNWVRDLVFYVKLPDDLVRRYALLAKNVPLPHVDDRALWPLGIAGIAVAGYSRERRRALVPALAVAYFVLFFMVFLPLPRFRHGVVPFLAVYAGGLVELLIVRRTTSR